MGNAGGVGLIAGVELMDQTTLMPLKPSRKIGTLVQDKCRDAGLIVRAIGDPIAFTPPLIITAEQTQDLQAMFKQGLDAALFFACA